LFAEGILFVFSTTFLVQSGIKERLQQFGPLGGQATEREDNQTKVLLYLFAQCWAMCRKS
jgi:hypothetical protein